MVCAVYELQKGTSKSLPQPVSQSFYCSNDGNRDVDEDYYATGDHLLIKRELPQPLSNES